MSFRYIVIVSLIMLVSASLCAEAGVTDSPGQRGLPATLSYGVVRKPTVDFLRELNADSNLNLVLDAALGGVTDLTIENESPMHILKRVIKQGGIVVHSLRSLTLLSPRRGAASPLLSSYTGHDFGPGGDEFIDVHFESTPLATVLPKLLPQARAQWKLPDNTELVSLRLRHVRREEALIALLASLGMEASKRMVGDRTEIQLTRLEPDGGEKENPYAQLERMEVSGKKWGGEPITLNLKNASLRDVLLQIGDITALNVVLHPSIKGSVTLQLERVPWDQIVDILARQHGLRYELEGTVLWFRPAGE